MREPLLALGLLLAAFGGLRVWLMWRRRAVMRASAADLLAAFDAVGLGALVLAFTTPECVPCRAVQRPALEALEQRYPGLLIFREVDAVRSPDLARRFEILTVPSTVVIGPDGKIRAINHGTATAERLAAQAGLNGDRA